MSVTPHTSYRLSGEARKLLAKLAHMHGLTRTAVIEWLIREHARSHGMKTKGAYR